MGPPVMLPHGRYDDQSPEDVIASATEENTPSLAGTPRFEVRGRPMSAGQSSHQQHLDGVQGPKPATVQTATVPAVRLNSPPAGNADQTITSEPVRQIASTNQAQPPAFNLSALEAYNLARSCAQRLDLLETLSFSQVPVEEIQEMFDLVDGRLLDLEHWRGDCEAQLKALEAGDHVSYKRRRLLPTEASSFSSDMSAPSTSSVLAITATAMQAEYNERLEEVEQRLNSVENKLPSYANPWEIEVVLLPWGRELGGIWSSLEMLREHESVPVTQTSEEWNGVSSSAKASFSSSPGQAHGWTTDSIQAWADSAEDWLCPKACGPKSVVFKRLSSRGLVRKLLVTSYDADTILGTVTEAFADFLRANKTDDTDHKVTEQVQALREPVIPLRKVRKNSRLRYLSRSEMVTSAVWTSSFLDSGIFMKAQGGQRRLYVTTAEAYVQSGVNGWTWQRLRELPRVQTDFPIQDAQATVDEADARESCWTHNPALDPPSLHSSFASSFSHQSQWSTRSQASQSNDRHKEDTRRPAPISPLSEQRPNLDPRRQTVSLPSSTAELPSTAQPKRRIASFESGYPKRRRTSSSPETERRGAGFTPRWSREPPSPFTSERSQAVAGAIAKRCATPSAYATPHSNTVATMGISGIGGGDTEPESEGSESRKGDDGEEWEGVAEENGNAQAYMSDGGVEHSDVGSEYEVDDDDDDDDSDDEDLDEGLTIYEERFADVG